jgi:hypothetical protein
MSGADRANQPAVSLLVWPSYRKLESVPPEEFSKSRLGFCEIMIP